MMDTELGPFLRARREALSPAQVGLHTNSRRRTPGLRRSELATLAGISVDYLIRLEQGRDRRPSAQVLAALGEALRLGADDMDHLRRLSARTMGAELCPSAQPVAQRVRPTIQALLDRLEPAPAFVVNRLSDLLAWTNGYAQLAGPVGILDRDPPNLLRFTFVDPRARQTHPDWARIADEQIADLRAGCRPDDHDAVALVEELSSAAGPGFTERWAARPVPQQRAGVQRILHPSVGELRLAFETLRLPDIDDQCLVVLLPADEASSAGLDRLAGRQPGGLRAVGG